MINDSMTRQGNWLFRWRSYILLGFAPLFVFAMMRPEPIEAGFGAFWDSAYETSCLALAFIGLGIRALTVGFVPAGTSGRNTRGQVADTLNTTGIYSLTRNPLYFGNSIIYVAVALFTQDIYVALTMALFLVIYLERIIAAEERFLEQKFGAAYLQWANAVPAFFPRLHGWRKPALPFSLRNVLKREYSGLFALVATFFVMDQGRDYLAEGARLDTAWLLFFIAGAAIYLTLRTLKKHTGLLNIAGR
jgi:protein-S-isoprenylcysteine O-methyltransferase Ste14